MSDTALIVIAKEPVPGRVKTRLTPPCSPAQAATLARASLLDTIDAVAHTPAARRVLVFDGDPAGLCPEGFDVIPQRGNGLGQRLAAAFDDVTGPALLVGMDTPQLTPGLLRAAAAALCDGRADAVLGPALDGGYWAVGFRRAAPGAFAGVPMSRQDTCAVQRLRLRELGLRVHEPPALRDLDTIEDARALSRQAPHTRFARAFSTI